MDAIVTAGGIPEPDDPLYPFTQGAPKALLDIAGKPMVQWVLDALEESNLVDRVVLVGLTPDNGIYASKIKAFVPNRGNMLDNVRAGMEKVLEMDPDPRILLTVSSDIPAVTGDMVDWLVDTVEQTENDVYYCVISRQVMETRYPDSRRSYTHLKDAEVCGGDMNVVHSRMITANAQVWERILEARKNVFKQASLIGFSTLLLLLFRRLNLEGGIKRVTERLNITGRVIFSPYAEIGMDIDKPHQLEILRKDLAQRVRV